MCKFAPTVYMAFPSTIKFPWLTGMLSAAGKPLPETIAITDTVTLTKRIGNTGGQALYEYGVSGVKPITCTVRKGRINRFGLQTLTIKGTVVPSMTDPATNITVIDPKLGHAPFSGMVQVPVTWPEVLMNQILTATIQSLTGVAFATHADMIGASNQAGNVLKAAAAGEV